MSNNIEEDKYINNTIWNILSVLNHKLIYSIDYYKSKHVHPTPDSFAVLLLRYRTCFNHELSRKELEEALKDMNRFLHNNQEILIVKIDQLYKVELTNYWYSAVNAKQTYGIDGVSGAMELSLTFHR